jgi:hypothetical protein
MMSRHRHHISDKSLIAIQAEENATKNEGRKRSLSTTESPGHQLSHLAELHPSSEDVKPHLKIENAETSTTHPKKKTRLGGFERAEDQGESDPRGPMSSYKGELWNPLLKSKNFAWPEHRTKKLTEMEKEGWITDPNENKHIGVTVRRFFDGFGKADGVVVAYLRGESNRGRGLWHVVHQDGDSEDISDDDFQRCRTMFLTNHQSRPTPPTQSLPTPPPPPPTCHRLLSIERAPSQGETISPQVMKPLRLGSQYQVELGDIPLYNEQAPLTLQSSTHTTDQDTKTPAAHASEDEYKSFLRLAKEAALLPGVLTRYMGRSSSKGLTFLQPLCVVKSCPPDSLLLVFDGYVHHVISQELCAFPLVEQLDLINLWTECGENITEGLKIVSSMVNCTLSLLPSEHCFDLFLFQWKLHGSDLWASWKNSKLQEYLSYKEFCRLYHNFLPLLCAEGGARRLSSLYRCSASLRTNICICCSQVEGETAEDDKIVFEGRWGEDDESVGLFIAYPRPHIVGVGQSHRKESDGGTGFVVTSSCMKPVEQVHEETGDVLGVFPSGAAAGRATGVNSRAISECCTGRRRVAGGYRWRFKDGGGLVPPEIKQEKPSGIMHCTAIALDSFLIISYLSRYPRRCESYQTGSSYARPFSP